MKWWDQCDYLPPKGWTVFPGNDAILSNQYCLYSWCVGHSTVIVICVFKSIKSRLLTYPSCKVCFVNKPVTRERGWLISTPQIFLSTWLVRNSFSWKPLCEIHLDKNILIPSTHSEIVVIVIQALSNVQLFATQWTAACQAFLSFTVSWGFSNSCPLSQWCHPTISSSVALFFSL